MTMSFPSQARTIDQFGQLAISLPEDVPGVIDRRLIELENQVQRLMEAYLALTQPTQVNKITTSCEICSGPYDNQYCMEDPEQAFVEYASLRTDEAGDARLSKFEADFKRQQGEMTNKIDTVLKAITDQIAGTLPSDTVKNPKLGTHQFCCSVIFDEKKLGSRKAHLLEDKQIPSVGHLEEIHVTWAHLEKKQTKLRLYTIYLEELCIQSVETALRLLSDDVRILSVMDLATASGHYSKPSDEGYKNTIELPEGNNVVPLRSDTIRLVQNRCLFNRLRSEDPNQHLKDFLKLVDSLDLDGSISTWEDLTTCFLAQFFPPGRTTKLRNDDILMFQQHQGESLSEAWTRFKDLLQKVPHHGIDLWLQVQIFYDHVTPATRRTIDQSDGGKLRDRNAKESWSLVEDLALYDKESWNDPRDFAKPVKAISLPQDVPSTSDRRLIELEHQVQCLMEAYIALIQPTQVNKITS
ncbi:zinc finger, CCHC-type containing protein [Tanacetum coccineum]